MQYARGQVKLNQVRKFESGATGCVFTGAPVDLAECGEFKGVIVEVAGNGYYTGSSTFTVEEDDPLRKGFLMR